MIPRHRLLAITQEGQDPATRYRIALHLPFLRAKGVDAVATPWPRGEYERGALLERATEFDSVVVQRRLLPRNDWNHLRRNTRLLAYDFDDAVMYRDSYHGHPWLLPDRLVRFRQVISECDAVTAGNKYLADLAFRFGKNARIHQVPTTLLMGSYNPLAHHFPSARISAGWIGQHTNLPYLEALASPLRELARLNPGFSLVTISDRIPRIEGIALETVLWKAETEAQALAGIDVGLAPLADNTWTRGKCGLRALQFLASGIPSVVSPVGTQQELAEKGGCLAARSEDEWVSAVTQLINDEPLRRSIATQGRKIVEQHFVPARWTEALLSAWCGIQLMEVAVADWHRTEAP
jgi:Glycosyl transferases group 1